MRRRRFLLACAGACLATIACAKTDEPADPVWGKEPCAHCAMLVGDRRAAAQLSAGGQRRFFDDIGCMVLWIEKAHVKPERVWVREGGLRWVDAKTTRYAHGARTPMDFGFAPAAEGMGWDEMREKVIAKEASR
jgi:hypothetical protein